MEEVEQCPPSAPMPYKTLVLTYFSVLVAVVLVPHNLVFKVAAFLCTITTLLTIYNKVNYNPLAVFLMAMACVILNTFAVGAIVSFKYAVIISPIISVAQAFLTLPFKIKYV